MLRRKSFRWLGLPMVMVLWLVLVLGACAPQPPAAAPQATPALQKPAALTPTVAIKRGGVIMQGTGEPPNADVHQGSPLTELEVFSDIHRSILQVNYLDRKTIIPDIATSWESNATGDVFTFKIRQGIKDSQGQPFGIDDVIYNLNRIKTRPNGIAVPRWAGIRDLVASAEKKDEETLVIRLSSSAVSFMPAIAGAWSLIQPMRVLKVIDAPGQKRDLTPEEIIGIGPFKLKQWTRGSSFEVVKNENYWEYPERPYLDGYQFFFFRDPTAQLAAARAGRILLTTDTATLGSKLVVDAAESRGDQARVVDVGYLGLNSVIFNVQKPPFNNVELRKAVNLAIDRKLNSEITWNGYARPIGVYEPSWDWVVPESEYLTWPGLRSFKGGLREEDLAEARRLMQKNGYGPDNMLKTEINTDTSITKNLDAQLLVDSLKKIYIDLSIRSMDSAAFYQSEVKGDLFLTVNYTSLAYEDPDEFNAVLFLPEAGRNVGKWRNEPWLKLYDQQKVERDRAKRGALLRQMAKIWWDDMSQAPLVLPVLKQYVDARVQNYNPPLFNQANYRHDYMWLK